MKILFLQQQRIKPKSPCPNFDLPYPHFQDSAFYSAHLTPLALTLALWCAELPNRTPNRHPETSPCAKLPNRTPNRRTVPLRCAELPPHTPNRQTVPLRCAELPLRTPNRRTVPLRCAELPDRTPGRRRKACSCPPLHSGLDPESRLAGTGSCNKFKMTGWFVRDDGVSNDGVGRKG